MIIVKRKDKNNKQNSLQTHKQLLICRSLFQKFYRRQDGSAVVEAAIGVPIFLCAIAVIFIMAEMIFTQAQIYYALSQTVQMYAQIQSVNEQKEMAQAAEIYTTFYSFLGKDQIYRTCVKGGNHGIVLSPESTEDHVKIQAGYYLTVPIPYFDQLGFYEQKTCTQRLFSGYVVHSGSEDKTDPVVYLSENASVYHTTMSCTHICIKISDASTIRGILVRGTHKPCKKCITAGERYSNIYLTAYGDSYHSTLSCSALKRTIRAVRLSETGGLRACSRCGKP